MPRTKGSKNRSKSAVEVAIKNEQTERYVKVEPEPEQVQQLKRKPCPKCKNTGIGQTYTDGHAHDDKIKHGRHYFLYCAVCGHKGSFSRLSYEEAEKFWNE